MLFVYTNNVARFLILLAITVSYSASAYFAGSSCELDKSNLIEKYDKELASNDRFDSGLKELRGYLVCDNLDEDQKALVSYLLGNVYFKEYSNTKNPEYAKASEESFSNALNLSSDFALYANLSMAQLLRERGDFRKATVYINKALSMEMQNKRSFLATALLIAVDSKEWDVAYEHIRELYEVYDKFYFAPGLLKPTVDVLCHQRKGESARNAIRNVEAYQKEYPSYTRTLTEDDYRWLEEAKRKASDC